MAPHTESAVIIMEITVVKDYMIASSIVQRKITASTAHLFSRAILSNIEHR